MVMINEKQQGYPTRFGINVDKKAGIAGFFWYV
jgi:hypothetical protein